jgi:RNA polymerase sigma factor (sigma-70 family)
LGFILTLTSDQIEDLFHQYRDELTRRLVAMVNSRDTAADLLQETYVKLLGLVNTQAVEHPRALLHRIATNLAIDYLRKQKKPFHAVDSLDAAMEVPCGSPCAERIMLGKERLQLSLQAIDKLPPRTREAFLLYRVYGYSYREIAARMGISDSGVEKLLMRALDQFCTQFDPLDADE